MGVVSRHQRTNWIVVDETAERCQLVSRTMLGQRPDIAEHDVWQNIGENLSRQSVKASTLASLNGNRGTDQGSVCNEIQHPLLQHRPCDARALQSAARRLRRCLRTLWTALRASEIRTLAIGRKRLFLACGSKQKLGFEVKRMTKTPASTGPEIRKGAG